MFVMLLFHMLAYGVQTFGLLWDILQVKPYDDKKHPAIDKFQFFTFWNAIVQVLYWGICLFNDMHGSNIGPKGSQQKRQILQKVRDALFTSIAWPIGTFVVLTFWALYAIDRELVFPTVLDDIIPSWLNHVMHTTPLVFLLIERIMVYHWSSTRSTDLKRTLIFVGLYQSWILFIAWHLDVWVYPVLKVLSPFGRFTFFAGLWIAIIIIYEVGQKFMQFIWGPVKIQEKVL